MTGSRVSDHRDRDGPKDHQPFSTFSSYGDELRSSEQNGAPADDRYDIRSTPSVESAHSRAPGSRYPYKRFDGGFDSRLDLELGDRGQPTGANTPPFTPESGPITDDGPLCVCSELCPAWHSQPMLEPQESTQTAASNRPSTSRGPAAHESLHAQVATKTTTKTPLPTYKPTGSPEKAAEDLKRRNASAVARFRRFVNSERRQEDLKHVFMSKGYDRKAASLLADYEMMRLKELVG